MDLLWTDNVVPRSSDFLYAVYFAVFFAVARILLDRLIYRHVALWLLSIRSTPLKIYKSRRLKIAKCSESLWKLGYYVSLEFLILMAIFREPFFTDVEEFFRGWPNQGLKPALKLIYMCECGFYTYSMTALLTWETRRKDFVVMLLHHVVTVILISFSYITRFFRIGSVILALHDASDVFLEAAKVFKYSGNECGASLFFGLFAISWLVLRLIYFPFWVIRSSSFVAVEFLNLGDSYHMLMFYVFNTMLLTLLVFHVYWWFLICSMIMRQLKNGGKVGQDIRSDSEGDD